ncbi:serine acetyltransferase [Clostridium saudiense]|uniref:serine acetyltransferase n=1 Tax=Clostridium saudiense TaxID=1414720 RepID=UPI0018ABEF0C|nr:serine acetyltransferase [Clostridium saudiense]
MDKKKYIYSDNKYFKELSFKTKIKLYLTRDHWVKIRKYLIYLRKSEYYYLKGTFIGRIISFFWERKKNVLGEKLGYHIPRFVLGINATIYHHGCIIINGDSKIGTGCIFHGNNCIGNNGINMSAPNIGDNVDLGFGAGVFGNVKLSNDIKVGAGAVVINSCLDEGATLVGIPAKRK